MNRREGAELQLYAWTKKNRENVLGETGRVRNGVEAVGSDR